jgi:NAD(P)-dependent dehydrogenase (short-subunit alcohol dehydrogenase family)
MQHTPNRAILITGASSGIGHASVRRFAEAGHRVFATYRNDAHRHDLAAIAGVHPVRMDVTNRDDVARGAEEIRDAVGDDGLYAVINNAGITYAAPFELADEQRFLQVMDVNVMAPFRITQTMLPLLTDHNRGAIGRGEPFARVINVASWAGLMAAPYIAAYNASKAAVISMTESMYYDLGLLDIHAVVAIPGLTRTPLLGTTTDDGTASLNAMSPEDQDRYRTLFEHFAVLGESSADNKMLSTPDKVAGRLLRITKARRPRFKYHVGPDARIVDRVVTHLPWRTRAAMNRHMYHLRPIPAPTSPLEPATV